MSEVLQKREKPVKTPEEIAKQIGKITTLLIRKASSQQEIHPNEVDRTTGTEQRFHKGDGVRVLDVKADEGAKFTSASLKRTGPQSLEAGLQGTYGNLDAIIRSSQDLSGAAPELSVEGKLMKVVDHSDKPFSRALSNKGNIHVAAGQLSTVRDVLSRRAIVNNAHIEAEMHGTEINTSYAPNRPEHIPTPQPSALDMQDAGL